MAKDRWFREAAQQAKVVETIQAMKAGTRAQGTPLGETGRFTHGALTPDDEGELRFAAFASNPSAGPSPPKLLSDYTLAAHDPVAKRVGDALRLSAHVLERDKSQLMGQLHGRLGADRDARIRGLLQSARTAESRAWLRPLTASLTPPGGPLVGTLAGHGGSVRGVAVTPDCRHVISGSWDQTVKVWDLATGVQVRTLAATKTRSQPWQ